MRPVFSSFDDAWRWFAEGGALEPLDEQRARFTAGRAQFLLFQAPVADAAIIDEAAAIQDALADIDGVTPFDLELLHVSVHSVGFQVIEARRQDEVLRQDVGGVSERAARILKASRPVGVRAGPVNVFADALMLEVHDDGALASLRQRLIEARAGSEPVEAPPFLPHITIGTFADPAVAGELRERLPALRERPPVTATLRRIELTRWWFTGVDALEVEPDTVRSYVLRG